MRRRGQAGLEAIVGAGLLGVLLIALVGSGHIAWIAALERVAQTGAERALREGRDPLAGARVAVPPGFRHRIALEADGRVRMSSTAARP